MFSLWLVLTLIAGLSQADPVWADDRSDEAELRDSGGLLVAKYP